MLYSVSVRDRSESVKKRVIQDSTRGIVRLEEVRIEVCAVFKDLPQQFHTASTSPEEILSHGGKRSAEKSLIPTRAESS